MLTTPEIVLVAVLAALVVVGGFFGARFASAAHKALEQREADRADELPPPRPARPASNPKRRRRR